MPDGERGEVPRPRALPQVAVQFGGGDAGLGELAGEPLGAVLGPGEDQRPLVAADQRGDAPRACWRRLDGEHVVLDLGRGGVLVDRVQHRVAEEAAGEHVDGGVEGGGEQHPLAAVRRRLEQPPDDRQEAEVGHLVGLVDDRDLDVGQVALALADQVGEPAGGGDDDVGPPLQRVHLRAVGDAAVDGGDPQAHRPRERLEHLGHLGGELAGRHEDEAARPARDGRPAGQPGDQRKGEAQGLARAGLRPAEDVPAGQRVGQGGRLDGERRGDPVLVEDRQPAGRARQARRSWWRLGYGSLVSGTAERSAGMAVNGKSSPGLGWSLPQLQGRARELAGHRVDCAATPMQTDVRGIRFRRTERPTLA